MSTPVFQKPIPFGYLDTDTALTANSDVKVPSQKAVKTYVDTQIPDAVIDAKGDLIAGSADNTPARLAVGTNGQVLEARSTEATGLKWVDPIGTNSFVTETPSGTVNGSNTAFTLANTYSVLILTRNGQVLEGGGADYTLSGTDITFVTAPPTDSSLKAYGVTASTVSGNADTLDGYHANATPTANNIPVLNASKDLDLDTGDVIATDVTAEGVMKVAGAITQTGTADHVTITPGTSKLVKISVLRQNITTNSYENNSIILCGWDFKIGTTSRAVSDSVTFGITFSSAPVVLISSLNTSGGSTPDSIDDFSAQYGEYIAPACFSITTGGFSWHAYGAANFTTGHNVGVSWLAIGTLS